MEGLYWLGVKQIKQAIDQGKKTPLDNPMLFIEYVDGTNEEVSKVMYDRLVSLKSRPIEELYHIRAAIFADLTFSMLQEYGMKWGEASYYQALLKTSIEKHREASDKILYGKSRDDITLLDLYEVIKKDKKTLEDILKGGV